jgi:CheY-like chemotaxis protein
LNIVVVDDNPCDVYLLRHALQESGVAVQVDSVSNGSALLSRLRTGASPNLLVLDLSLPGESGLDILKVLQADASLRNLKSLVLSGVIPPQTEAALQGLGAPFATKPGSLEGWMTVARQIEDLLKPASPSAPRPPKFAVSGSQIPDWPVTVTQVRP